MLPPILARRVANLQARHPVTERHIIRQTGPQPVPDYSHVHTVPFWLGVGWVQRALRHSSSPAQMKRPCTTTRIVAARGGANTGSGRKKSHRCSGR